MSLLSYVSVLNFHNHLHSHHILFHYRLCRCVNFSKNLCFGNFLLHTNVCLLSQAWRLWTDDKLLDLMDETLRDTCIADQFVKCLNIGLLCVQHDPSDHPTMSIIIKMLDGETVNLPTPKQPAFFVGNLTKIQTREKQNRPRENTRQRKQSHAQDNIYMVRQFAYIHGVVGISLLSGKIQQCTRTLSRNPNPNYTLALSHPQDKKIIFFLLVRLLGYQELSLIILTACPISQT